MLKNLIHNKRDNFLQFEITKKLCQEQKVFESCDLLK